MLGHQLDLLNFMQLSRSQVLFQVQSLSPISQEDLNEWARLSPNELKSASRAGALDQFFLDYCREDQIRVAQASSAASRTESRSSQEVLRSFKQRASAVIESDVVSQYPGMSPRGTSQSVPGMGHQYARLNQSYQAYLEYMRQQQQYQSSVMYQAPPGRRVAYGREANGGFPPHSPKDSVSEDMFPQHSVAMGSESHSPSTAAAAWVSLTPAAYYGRLLSLNYVSHPYRGKPDFLVDRVVLIQAVWRGWVIRKKLQLAHVLNRAATFIQCVFRGRIARKRTRPLLKQLHKLRLMDAKKKLLSLEQAKQEEAKINAASEATKEQISKPSNESKSLEAKISQLEEMNIKMREKLEQQSELMMNFLAGQNLNQMQSSQQILEALNQHFNRLNKSSGVQVGSKADKTSKTKAGDKKNNKQLSGTGATEAKLQVETEAAEVKSEQKQVVIAPEETKGNSRDPGIVGTVGSAPALPVLSLGEKLKAIRLSQTSQSGMSQEQVSVRSLLEKRVGGLWVSPKAQEQIKIHELAGPEEGKSQPVVVSNQLPSENHIKSTENEPVQTEVEAELEKDGEEEDYGEMEGEGDEEAAEEMISQAEEEHEDFDAGEQEVGEEEKHAEEEAGEEEVGEEEAGEEEAEEEGLEENEDGVIAEASSEDGHGEDEESLEELPHEEKKPSLQIDTKQPQTHLPPITEAVPQQRTSASSSSKVATSGFALSTLNKINQLLPMSPSQKRLFANMNPGESNYSGSDRSNTREVQKSQLQQQYQRHSLLSGKLSAHSNSSSSLPKGGSQYNLHPSTKAFNTLYEKGAGSKSGSRILDTKKPSVPKVNEFPKQPNSSDQRNLATTSALKEPNTNTKAAGTKPTVSPRPVAPQTSTTLRSILKSTTTSSYKPTGSSFTGGRLAMPKR